MEEWHREDNKVYWQPCSNLYVPKKPPGQTRRAKELTVWPMKRFLETLVVAIVSIAIGDVIVAVVKSIAVFVFM
eukprot:2424109-Ditylum_brightwellii.AAC.1